jgi:hypothetical protein
VKVVVRATKFPRNGSSSRFLSAWYDHDAEYWTRLSPNAFDFGTQHRLTQEENHTSTRWLSPNTPSD